MKFEPTFQYSLIPIKDAPVHERLYSIGVNMGVLPTKGLTLPMMSYGGNSLIVFCMLLGILLRVEYENRQDSRQIITNVEPTYG